MKPLPFDFRNAIERDLNHKNKYNLAEKICNEIGLQFIHNTDLVLFNVLDRIHPHSCIRYLDISSCFKPTYYSILSNSDKNKAGHHQYTINFQANKYASSSDSINKFYEKYYETFMNSLKERSSLVYRCILDLNSYKEVTEHVFTHGYFSLDREVYTQRIHMETSKNLIQVKTANFEDIIEIFESLNSQSNNLMISQALSLIPKSRQNCVYFVSSEKISNFNL